MEALILIAFILNRLWLLSFSILVSERQSVELLVRCVTIKEGLAIDRVGIAAGSRRTGSAAA